ncbi:hypothetical protein MKX07_007874 [Trichoderma sp. CBMAI-0711]|uniref:ER-bound oxygenase mpaB/mpaB'/Rubber oxygenase catalytic domain-containing protein n=1 Tax=Trichoderma parareesei TaxID=858221 RepID=A0A2H2ZN34_TRIPA|nr:hypothetical protein MKX07_007874 [Trichoderma sp. CBMAI-0711]OTA01471.1 hypothetical protein A9Z42_0017710 [Trichoderma parareesei]
MAFHRVGNYTFQWTEYHLPREKTEPLRHEYDTLGHNAVKRLQQIARQRKGEASVKPTPCPGGFDMYAVLRDYHDQDDILNRLWNEVHTVPDWVDWAQIERGQKFFYRYAPANLMGFMLQAFVGENSSAPGVVEVLVRTGGFSTKVLLRRLLETFQHLLQVTANLQSIQPGGQGHTTTVRVRLLHAAVRERILRLVKTRPDYFDVAKFGVPVNVLDSIHSICVYSCGHMWLQLPQMGVFPTEQEKADYIALFRYVGYLLATPHEYFSSVAQAKATMESMLLHELQVTETSRIVGHNLIECVKDLAPLRVSVGFIEAGSRLLNGDELCDSLGLGKPGFLAYGCWRGHCWFVQSLALVQRWIPGADEAVVRYFRNTLYETLVNSKRGLGGRSEMDFKHVPRLGKRTGKEGSRQPRFAGSFVDRPLEMFYLAVFGLGCVLWLGIVGVILRMHLLMLS